MKLSKKILNIVSQNFNFFVEYERFNIHYLLSTAHKNAVISELNKSIIRNNSNLVENDEALNSAVPGLAAYLITVINSYHNVCEKAGITITNEDISPTNPLKIDVYLREQLNSAVLPEDKKSKITKALETIKGFKDGATIAHKSKLILKNLGLRSIFSIAIGIPSFIIFSALKLAYYTASTLLQIPATIIVHPFSKNSQVTEIKQGEVTPLSSNNAKPSVELHNELITGRTTPIIHSRSPSTSSLQHSQMDQNDTINSISSTASQTDQNHTIDSISSTASQTDQNNTIDSRSSIFSI